MLAEVFKGEACNKCKVFTLAFQAFDNEQLHRDMLTPTTSSGACHSTDGEWTKSPIDPEGEFQETLALNCSFVVAVAAAGVLYFCNRKPVGCNTSYHSPRSGLWVY